MSLLLKVSFQVSLGDEALLIDQLCISTHMRSQNNSIECREKVKQLSATNLKGI